MDHTDAAYRKEIGIMKRRVLALENDVTRLEKKGVKLNIKSKIASSAFATFNTTAIVTTIMLFILFKGNILG